MTGSMPFRFQIASDGDICKRFLDRTLKRTRQTFCGDMQIERIRLGLIQQFLKPSCLSVQLELHFVMHETCATNVTGSWSCMLKRMSCRVDTIFAFALAVPWACLPANRPLPAVICQAPPSTDLPESIPLALNAQIQIVQAKYKIVGHPALLRHSMNVKTVGVCLERQVDPVVESHREFTIDSLRTQLALDTG